jgi:hypothetical protein
MVGTGNDSGSGPHRTDSDLHDESNSMGAADGGGIHGGQLRRGPGPGRVDLPEGLIELARAEANQGTQGAKGVHDQVTSMGAKCWGRSKRKLLDIIPQLAQWKFTNRSYSQLLLDRPATVFVDPPYSNAAGRRYRVADIDYAALATWCLNLAKDGHQVIVCENLGADWLPFTAIEHRRVSIKSRYQNANAKEVMWVG